MEIQAETDTNKSFTPGTTKRVRVRPIPARGAGFLAAFGMGADDKHIATVDEEGVALVAIQGLNQKVEKKEASIQELGSRTKSRQRKFAM
jgi:hypothetical protein